MGQSQILKSHNQTDILFYHYENKNDNKIY